MNRIIKTTAALCLVLVMGFSFLSVESHATSYLQDTERALSLPNPHGFDREYVSANKVQNKAVTSYAKGAVYINGGAIATDVRVINGVVYVATRSFFEELTNMKVTYNAKTRILYINGAGLNMEIIDGGNVIYANGRTLYDVNPSVIMTNGRMYTPIEPISRALGLSSSPYGSATQLKGEIKPLKSGEKFYDADAVYWLSRIISAESKGESLIGQIAVGNIVLNRVKSPLYPNTIWGVIFDRKYGVQFSPILNGTIYNTPTAVSVTAAKICLEGYSVSEEALFFLQPRLSTSSWIPKNREYLFTIGNHDFYR